MERVEGKRQHPLTSEQLAGLASGYERRLIDVGCGDGRYVLRQARADPACLCIGLDANADAMRESAWRAAAKPARGGAPNAIYIVSSVEGLPDDLVGIATRLTIQYPWGSLLRILIEPDLPLLEKIARLAVAGAPFSVLINLAVFDDPGYAARLDLPPLDESRFRSALVPAWASVGLAVESVETEREAAEASSSWGKRLVKGSGREVLAIAGTVRPRLKHAAR
jgi:16S rRNA (adenine(1408)-N(1))-methyltransferase